jgi:hypothetical protein
MAYLRCLPPTADYHKLGLGADGILAAQPQDVPVFLGYRHSPVGTTVRNTIHPASRLLLPVLPPAADSSATSP